MGQRSGWGSHEHSPIEEGRIGCVQCTEARPAGEGVAPSASEGKRYPQPRTLRQSHLMPKPAPCGGNLGMRGRQRPHPAVRSPSPPFPQTAGDYSPTSPFTPQCSPSSSGEPRKTPEAPAECRQSGRHEEEKGTT